jgi:hypothetical protein
VGVAYVVAVHRPFSADFTFHCHGRSPKTNCPQIGASLPFFAFTKRRFYTENGDIQSFFLRAPSEPRDETWGHPLRRKYNGLKNRRRDKYNFFTVPHPSFMVVKIIAFRRRGALTAPPSGVQGGRPPRAPDHKIPNEKKFKKTFDKQSSHK